MNYCTVVISKTSVVTDNGKVAIKNFQMFYVKIASLHLMTLQTIRQPTSVQIEATRRTVIHIAENNLKYNVLRLSLIHI